MNQLQAPHFSVKKANLMDVGSLITMLYDLVTLNTLVPTCSEASCCNDETLGDSEPFDPSYGTNQPCLEVATYIDSDSFFFFALFDNILDDIVDNYRYIPDAS